MYNKYQTQLVYLPCRIIAQKETVDHCCWFSSRMLRLHMGNISKVFNKKQSTFLYQETEQIFPKKYVTKQEVGIDKENNCSVISMTPCCDKKEWMQKPPTEGVRIELSI